MRQNEIRYCLSKQLGTAHTVQTDYGDIELDSEMKAAIEKALRPILENRVERLGVTENP